ncbi:hypothetical protein D4764_14G0008020 [Takifugu flavidus]|uniref:Uncharacterized protein n=1 Tax=Takifugu flavidus TaxID=433684 RepID=A0A5C6P760_9TELE|nr:hypothetical protein D4764_14G0008020 [Takifugu flavidus]
MTPKCSTGRVGIEDSADGSAMLRSTPSGITAVLGDTGAALLVLSSRPGTTPGRCHCITWAVTFCPDSRDLGN